MVAFEEIDVVPEPVCAMSSKLATRVSESGLTLLKPVLENAGILTYACLSKLGEEEVQEMRQQMRAAGFGLGHARAFAELCAAARSTSAKESDSPNSLDVAPLPNSLLSPKLHFRLKRRGIQGLETILGQAGVQTFACLSKLNDTECAELYRNITAAGFKQGQLTALAELVASARGSSMGNADPCGQASVIAASPVTIATPPAAHCALGERHGNIHEDEGLGDGVEIEPPRKRSKTSASDSGSEQPPKYDSSGTNAAECSKLRVSMDALADTMTHLKSMKAEVVRYRDRATGKMVDVRIPSLLLALLRLRALCNGKPESEQRLARMALDVMEEKGYDPIRAVASLSPGSLLCPTSAMRLLGSGAIGVVFLEETTGNVVKVMLEDFAKDEYDVFCAFANVGLAPRPIALVGPHEVPGGTLFSIRMEAITHTLLGVLQARAPTGQRLGLNPPSEVAAQRIAESLVGALQRMWDHGLVHGDLHLENIAIKDPTAKPMVQVLDFGRSARSISVGKGTVDALRAGHEYDVFRLLPELCDSFDELRELVAAESKDCEKEMRELRSSRTGDPVAELHQARQAQGLQAHVADESKVLEQVQVAYDIVCAAVAQYASAKLDFSFDGAPSVRNRKLRQAAVKRQKMCYNGYFKSDLFWGADA